MFESVTKSKRRFLLALVLAESGFLFIMLHVVMQLADWLVVMVLIVNAITVWLAGLFVLAQKAKVTPREIINKNDVR